jgi:thiosulfate dehydrogenase
MNEKNPIVTPALFAIACCCILLILICYSTFVVFNPSFFFKKVLSHWQAPDTLSIPNTAEGKQILYGRELIRHTSVYLGPKGTVIQTSNGMNCQNCHLEAGTIFFGNNYAAVASTYPKLRARSGAIESIEKRVNDCFERSLNGKAIADDSKEMRAIISYIKWVGKEVEKDISPEGSGLVELPKLNRAADSVKGKIVYQNLCMRCHGENAEGQLAENGLEWKYPPLSGENSFNIGAGLYRLSRFAGFIKVNMPNDLASYEKPVLIDEEAWDVAAYIISFPRPLKDISKDWPDISKKPFDHPFGPYVDPFSERQHKYGPFIPTSMKKSK